MAWTQPRTWTAGEVVTAAHMNNHIRDNLTAGFTSEMFQNTTWNCTIDTTGSTGPNKQSIAGDYVRTGPLVTAWGKVLMDGSTNFGGSGAQYVIAPPKNLASYIATGSVAGAVVGSGFYYDLSAVDTYLLSVIAYSTVKFILRFNNVGSSEIGVVNSTNPVAVSTGDRFSFMLSYPTTAT